MRRFSYTYDGANNRLSQTKDLGSGPQTTSYGYNSANEMTSAGSTTYSYDANGNETGWSGGPTLTYNAKDQMTALGTLALSYLGPNQVELISDGAALVGNDVLGVASRGQEFYTRTDDGEVLAKRNGSSNNWYLHDGIGSVVGVTDASGAGAGGYTYDPFGNPLGTAPNIPWGYAGGYAGPWGGIYHFGYRFYDPTVGRWTQQDPIMGPGDLQEANGYTYVGNSPIDSTDPTGLVPAIEPCTSRLGFHCPSRSPDESFSEQIRPIIRFVKRVNESGPVRAGKFIYHVFKCASRRAESRGTDPSQCNSF